MKRTLLISSFFLGCLCFFPSCNDDDNGGIDPNLKVKTLSDEMLKVRDYVPTQAVVGHRGTAYWAPESTEASYRWAREAGVDYLEADLQLTSDGVIVIVHDNNILDKTNVMAIFPDKNAGTSEAPNFLVKDFTLAELRQLDAGSWFNNKDHKDQWKTSFAGLKILTLEELIMIAEGNKIVYNSDGSVGYEADPAWNGNKPGIYIETKEPRLNPGQNIEQKLYDELDRLNWNIVTKPSNDKEFYKNGKVNIGNTNGKVVLQTFSRESLQALNTLFKGKIPSCLLLWLDPADAPYSMASDTQAEFVDWINFGVDNGAQFLGPSIPEVITEGAGSSSTYADLLSGWRSKLMHSSKMYIHPYTFDKVATMEKYYNLCEGMFTNIGVEGINFYKSKGYKTTTAAPEDGEAILNRLGY